MFAKSIPFIFLGLFIAACGQTSQSNQTDFVDAEGNTGRFSDFHGRWLVVNYWAEWCGPCIEEIPELNALHDAHKDQDAYVLGVHFDQPLLDELKKQIGALDVQFPVLQHDPRNLLGYPLPEVLPTTYLFDRAGKLQHKLSGPQTRERIESLLK